MAARPPEEPMSHYERRLQADLDAIHAEVAAIGGLVEHAVMRAVRCLLDGDPDEAAEVILDDLPINRRVRALDARCHAFVARHLPAAGPLRTVSSVLRINIALERIGDYATTIAREAVKLQAPVPDHIARHLRSMDERTRHMLRQAIQAWTDENPDLARGTMAMADGIDLSLDNGFQDLLAAGSGPDPVPLHDLFALLIVFNRLERVSDQAKNLCEETVFATTGQAKAPKVYRILFVDEHGDGFSQLARAMAIRAFPESGHYEAAGWDAAAIVDPVVRDFMEARGLDAEGIQPVGIQQLDLEGRPFHVIVDLAPEYCRRTVELPFRSVCLRWDLGPGPGPGDDPETVARKLEYATRELSGRITSLIERLRGPDAR
ncbi:MAG: hypothetical protein D6798_19940 [Deltaproteobacteria bacterium]|nr:MAG: hypothetical protein D6798_19940 [Deltaproteobacteria bacterium]